MGRQERSSGGVVKRDLVKRAFVKSGAVLTTPCSTALLGHPVAKRSAIWVTRLGGPARATGDLVFGMCRASKCATATRVRPIRSRWPDVGETWSKLQLAVNNHKVEAPMAMECPGPPGRDLDFRITHMTLCNGNQISPNSDQRTI